ncbi:MAG: CsaA, csaA protein [uncultured bacterium]|nr:MAG: CsaA, csaA protein [uncultured bacterium]
MTNISFADFEKVDIRIGTVVAAEVPEWSHWVMKLEVDFGDELGRKKAFSGIMKFYKPEDLIGKQFPFVVNLEPKKIGPEKELSEAMMIMASPGDAISEEEAEDVAPILFELQKKVPKGTKVR